MTATMNEFAFGTKEHREFHFGKYGHGVHKVSDRAKRTREQGKRGSLDAHRLAEELERQAWEVEMDNIVKPDIFLDRKDVPIAIREVTPAALQVAGQAIFGLGWQVQLAEWLGVTDRAVRTWVSGRVPVPEEIAAADGALDAIRALLDDHFGER